MTLKQCPSCSEWTTDTNCQHCNAVVREESTAEMLADLQRRGYLFD